MGDPGAPMFSSVLRGIESLRARPPRGVFVLPVDVPAPGADVWEELGSEERVRVPVYAGKRGHPVYLPWEWVRTHVLDANLDWAARLDELVQGEEVEVEVDDPSVAINLNTPEDVAAFIAGEGG